MKGIDGGETPMAEQTILIIRHAEKPESDSDSGDGVDATGALDPKSLTPRGWQRAGVWGGVCFPCAGTAARAAGADGRFRVRPGGPRRGRRQGRPQEPSTARDG